MIIQDSGRAAGMLIHRTATGERKIYTSKRLFVFNIVVPHIFILKQIATANCYRMLMTSQST